MELFCILISKFIKEIKFINKDHFIPSAYKMKEKIAIW